MITKEWEQIAKKLIKGKLPDFNEKRRPNKIKKVNSPQVSKHQQRAIRNG